MPLNAVVEYLIYRRQESAERQLFESFVATQLSVLAAGEKLESRVDYIELRDKILGKKKKSKIDKRTAKEIIEKTLKKHNIKIIRATNKEEANN